MEIEVVRRRMNMIAAHFSHNSDDLTPAHLLPLNCSSSLNSVIRRFDNRMNFARQNSSSQGFFMRQASTEQGCGEIASGVPRFSAPETESSSNASEVPMFSRPTKMEQNLTNSIEQSKSGGYDSPANYHPCFARPTKNKHFHSMNKLNKHFHSMNKLHTSQTNKAEWSPRMDVIESVRSYVMRVEIPGVDVSDIRVEVNDKNLIITGSRSSLCRKMGGCTSFSAYHKREIYQGPYRIVWPIPANVNKDNVTAEFINGLLQVIMPKV